MKREKKTIQVLVYFILLTLCTFLEAQLNSENSFDDALATITASELEENLYVLASDEYEGRDSGYPGDEPSSPTGASPLRSPLRRGL